MLTLKRVPIRACIAFTLAWAALPGVAVQHAGAAFEAATVADASPDPDAVTLAPAVDTTFTGLSETLTATVTHDEDEGAPIAGVAVTFVVNCGPNKGKTTNATTDAGGLAHFTYTSDRAGTDEITAAVGDENDHVSNPAGITWKQSGPPPIPEASFAVAAPMITLLLLGAFIAVPYARHRRHREVSKADRLRS